MTPPIRSTPSQPWPTSGSTGTTPGSMTSPQRTTPGGMGRRGRVGVGRRQRPALLRRRLPPALLRSRPQGRPLSHGDDLGPRGPVRGSPGPRRRRRHCRHRRTARPLGTPGGRQAPDVRDRHRVPECEVPVRLVRHASCHRGARSLRDRSPRPRLRQMVDEVGALAAEDGCFTATSMFRSWSGWSFADKRHPSPWLTFLVLRCAARLES